MHLIINQKWYFADCDIRVEEAGIKNFIAVTVIDLVLVTQSCLIFCNHMNYSLPGSSVHGISQARLLEWIAIPFSRGIFLTQGLNSGLLLCRQIVYHLSHQGSHDYYTCELNDRYTCGIDNCLISYRYSCRKTKNLPVMTVEIKLITL